MRRVASSAAPACVRGAAAVLCQIADGVAAAPLLPPRAASSVLPPARGAVLQSQRSAERASAPPTEVTAARHDGDDDATCLELAAAMTCMLVLFFGVPYVLPFLPALFAWYIWRTGSRLAALLLVAWCAEVAAPPRYTTWPAVTRLLRWPLWHTWRRYHRYEIIAEAPLDPHGVYIFCAHPHGVFPQAQWLTNPMGCDARALHEPRRGSADAAILSVFTMPAVRAAVSSIMLRLPGLRHVLQWSGCFPATRAAIERMLRAGTSVVLVPGGLAEAWESRSDAETLVLLQRKGFVRAALATGAALVPIYCFGNTACFRSRPPPERVRTISRRTRLGMAAFWGRWHLPIPFRAKLLVVVGRPLVPAAEDSVDTLHAKYCTALRALFEAHKARLGGEWKQKELVFT